MILQQISGVSSCSLMSNVLLSWLRASGVYFWVAHCWSPSHDKCIISANGCIFFELEANDCIEGKGIMIKFFPRILHLHKYIECDD
jgi:hypothetical protein